MYLIVPEVLKQVDYDIKNTVFSYIPGIVSKSKSENELQEVYNKLGALTKAIKLAETI